MFYCGTNILEYNPLNRTYKTLLRVDRLLIMSRFEDKLSDRNFLGVLSRSADAERTQHRIEVYDQHLNEIVWTETLSLGAWEPTKLLIHNSLRKVPTLIIVVFCAGVEEGRHVQIAHRALRGWPP